MHGEDEIPGDCLKFFPDACTEGHFGCDHVMSGVNDELAKEFII